MDESGNGSGRSTWQQKLKFRGLRLIGWTLPLMLASLVASSMVPHVPPKVLLDRPWGEKNFISGRVDTPKKGTAEVDVKLQIEGPLPLPKGAQASFRFKSIDGGDDVKKGWKLMPVAMEGKRWKTVFFTRIPADQTLAYLVRLKADLPKMSEMKFQLVADPERAMNTYLRYAELLFYPMLALSLLGGVMVIFPQFFAT